MMTVLATFVGTRASAGAATMKAPGTDQPRLLEWGSPVKMPGDGDGEDKGDHCAVQH